MKKNDFSPQLTEFLAHYLPELKNVSENTISAYCDTFRLFLGYCKDTEGMNIEKMSLKDLKPELVERFLHWLETERGNSIAIIASPPFIPSCGIYRFKNRRFS